MAAVYAGRKTAAYAGKKTLERRQTEHGGLRWKEDSINTGKKTAVYSAKDDRHRPRWWMPHQGRSPGCAIAVLVGQLVG